MKAFKYLAAGVGVLAIVAIVAAVAVAMLFDPNKYKGEIERLVKDQKNRTLKIEGDLKLAFWPNLGASLGKASLSERASGAEFASLESAHVSVALMPLFRGEAVVDALNLAGLRANIVKGKDGKFNFDDLIEAKPPAKAAPKAEPGREVGFDISGVKIERANLSYRDAATGQELAIADFNLRTGRIANDVPGKLELSASANGKNPALDAKVALSGGYVFNLERKSFALSGLDAKFAGTAFGVSGLDLVAKGDVASDPAKGDLSAAGLEVKAKGVLGKDAFEVKIAAPKLAIASDKASGSAVTAELTLKGTQTADARFKLSGVEGSAKSLSVAALSLDFDVSSSGNGAKGTLASPLKANLEAKLFELPKLTANLTISGPQMPQKSVTLPISGSVRADFAKENVAAELLTKFDESTVQAKLGVTRFEHPSYSFDVNIDRLNLDRYLPPKASKSQARDDAPVDLSGLKGLTAAGHLQIGAFQVERVKLSNLKAEIHAADGSLQVSPHTANLYGGSLSGALALKSSGNQIALKETLTNVAIGPLLKDLAERDALDGHGSVVLDVSASGASVNAMKKALAGSARLELKDGAVKGINLAETLRKAKSALGSKSAQQQGADKSQKTDFSELSASFAIKGGIAHNEDLSVKAPLLRLAGAGDIDIGNSTLNYLAKASVVATSKGQGGADLGHVAGLTIPVRLTGPFEAPKYEVDYGAIAADLAKSRITETITEKLGGKAGASGGKTVDKLRGLFGR